MKPLVATAPLRAKVGPWRPLPRRRNTTDVLRVVFGAAIVGLSILVAKETLPGLFEVNTFRLVNDLPSFVGPPLLGVMQFGALGAVPVFVVIALLGRHGRLAPLLAVAGAASWAAARLLQNVVDEDPPVLRVTQVVLHGTPAPGFAFPATHVAVAAALATVARGELARPARRLAWIVVATVAVARLYVGAHLPADVIGGLGLGWAVGGVVNLAIGVRPSVPDARQLEDVLSDAGRPARSVLALPAGRDGSARFRIDTDTGRRMMKAVGRDDPESDWLRRAWRALAFRRASGARTPVSAGHRVDHEAYVTLLAERAGVRVAPLVGTWSAGTTELVERVWIDGQALRDVPMVGDTVLQEMWTQLGRLEAIGIAHRVLPSAQTVIDAGGATWIIELGDARVGATEGSIVNSRAAALADLALAVGADRAVETLVEAMGVDAATETLSALQLVDLPTSIQSEVGDSPEKFKALLDRVAALSGVPPPPVSRAVRVATRNLLPVALAGIVLFVLLSHVGQAGAAAAALRSANPLWVGVAVLAAAGTYVLAAAAVVAAAPVRLHFGRTVAAQLAAASANRASPAGLGGMGLNLRYLEVSGLSRPTAGGVVALTTVTGFAVHLVLTTTLLLAQGRNIHFSLGTDLDPSVPLLLAMMVASTVIGGAVWYWRLHTRIAGVVRSVREAIRVDARSPGRLALLVGSAVGITLVYATALYASVHATGGHVSITTALIVYLAAGAVGALAPTPGGLGPLEAALIAGLSGEGVAAGPAVAGVLTYRLITYWLPVLPGLVCVAALRRRKAL